MEKKQAQEYIKQVLNSRFDQEQFELFVRNLLNEFEPRDNSYSGNLIPEAFRDHIAHYKRIGKYTDPEGEPMDILIVQTRSVNKLERTRTALRNFVVRHLKNFDKYYALVAFYSKEDDGTEWRLSLVKIDIEQERTEKGTIKAKEEIVPARRFSFLVGENENAHTAQKQLLPLLVNDHSNPLIIKEKDGDGSVEGAFSIERVTDEFYEQYKELYLKLTENAALTETLEKEGLDPVRFVKKLLGQIVFLYFLQKKGWLGVPKDQKMGEGPKNFLRKKFDEINDDGGSYFNDFLRFLFYDALAKEHNDEGIKYFNKNLGCKIPFLNGGLFEADYENWNTLDLNIDNLLFSNPKEKTKGGDWGTGILDVFDRYNFTIREDEPLEKEVAVDPEMLGKIYEKLFAEQKKHGAFYTPREIVHYMCQESLIHYLDNTVNHYTESYRSIDSDQTNLFGGSSDKKGNLKIEVENKGDIRVPKEDIEQFIRHGHLVLEHETTVTGKGKETDSYKYKLPENIRNNAEALDKALADIKICDPAIGSGAFPVGLLHEIVTARQVLGTYLNQSASNNQKNHSSDAYSLKRHAIQESIYGVDIDPSAIDIARLRLWLSMIVDEEDYETIDALPNLDYKIVCGDSLIGYPKNWKSSATEKIERLKSNFFKETNIEKKEILKKEIDYEISSRYASSEKTFGIKISFDFRTHFSEVWHLKNGFDIVIANPPYVSAWEMTKSLPDYRDKIRKSLFEYKKELSGHWDLFIAFVLLSDKLLNHSGSFIYILPNPILREKYAARIRKYLLTKKDLKSILHFDESNVFNKVSRKAVVIHCGHVPTKYQEIKLFRNSTWGTDNRNIIFDKTIKKENLIANDGFKFTIDHDQFTVEFLNRIESRSIKAGSLLYVNYGAQVSSKIPGEFRKKDVVSKEPTGNAKKFVEGKDVSRWKLKNRELWLDYRKDAMYGARTEALFENQKIIFRKVSDKNHRIAACIDKNQFYSDDGTVLAVLYKDEPQLKQSFDNIKIENETFPIEYVLAMLLNSITDYYFRTKFATESLQGATSHTYPKTIRQLPIYNQKPNVPVISSISSYILELSNNETELNIHRAFFIELLDAVVFDCYFKEELQSANKQILPHLGDLKPITDEMSEEEKLAIIQSEFERLYDPNHPVRNNLETLDSVEEVRIIKEALK